MKNYKKKLALGATTALLSVSVLAAPVLADVSGVPTKDVGEQTLQTNYTQKQQEPNLSLIHI